MYYGKPESISLKIDKDRYTLLHDYFGDRYQFVEHIDDTWDYLTDKLFEVRKAIDMLFLGDKDMQAKLIRITDETEEFVRSYERPGVVTRWKRINPRILFFECSFDLMEE